MTIDEENLFVVPTEECLKENEKDEIFEYEFDPGEIKFNIFDYCLSRYLGVENLA